MSEKPIIFSTDMVRAILDGRKTVTRRVIKPQPYMVDDFMGNKRWAHDKLEGNRDPLCTWNEEDIKIHIFESETLLCPYGYAGDCLWVRETHHIDWYPDDMKDARGRPGSVHYKANDDVISQSWAGQWRPSIFMPRWASRIQLRVTDVRVERVQDITGEQAKAEGISRREYLNNCDSYYMAFIELWDKINKSRGYGWDTNPWVWVVEFEVVKS